ncbi:MAG TPA: multicopper oxidase domain-containing protein [Anaerolineae bacterium]|nr:multicopper oxidase domain-containing protein [Anaerolineae bacterium]
MPHIEYWLQLENHAWDVMPNGVNRFTGETLQRDANGHFRPLPSEALIFRRYTPNWQAPDDHAINQWDLNEPDPSRTLGTIPGATIEAKVGDDIVVHFRNMDQRAGLSEQERTHSFHAYGLQHAALYDGAYPLAEADPAQGNKRGDRVASGESFDYHFTVMHLSNAGTWFYQDASMYAHDSVRRGAFGLIVVRGGGEMKPDLPNTALRQPNDTPMHFAALPASANRPDYLLVFHELEGVGICLNGRRALGNTPTLLCKTNSRPKFRVVNLCDSAQAFHIHGHRWARGEDWVDTALLAPASTTTFEILEGSAENGGGDGEWFITSATERDAAGSLLVTGGGSMDLETGAMRM